MMPNSICRFQFNIHRWNIVCNKVLTVEDWQKGEQHWADNSEKWAALSPKLAFLAPLKRRRLSESARLFFESAWDLVQDNANIPVVYASLNGEINRSFALWQSLLQDGDVSPTSFSLSVHNALVGQWSEMRQVTAETTAITAQKDNLEIALLEAYLLLNEGHSHVLVAIVETPLEPVYNVSPIERTPFAYALAMLVGKGEQYRLSLQSQAGSCSAVFANTLSDNSLAWVKHYHLHTKKWQTPASRGGYWQWQKN